MTRKTKRYGWIPSLPVRAPFYDHLDAPVAVIPSSVDLRPHCPEVYNQGNLGSCTANALAGAVEFERMKQSLTPNFRPSRLFIYYNERAIEGTVDYDSGAQIHDGIKTLQTQGACPEHMWPYDIAAFATQPPAGDYTAALGDRALQDQQLDNTELVALRTCLAEGYPFVFGFTVYESFESPEVARTGIVPMPGFDEEIIGGHAVMAVGYDDEKQMFIVRNSWGADWGLAGYCMFPYAYMTDGDLASDFWTIRLVTK